MSGKVQPLLTKGTFQWAMAELRRGRSVQLGLRWYTPGEVAGPWYLSQINSREWEHATCAAALSYNTKPL